MIELIWIGQKAKVYGPYHYEKEDDRLSVRLTLSDKTRISKSLTRFCVEYALDKQLPADIDIDHIDRDHSNNSLSNLQLLRTNDHARKDAKPALYVDITCVLCKKTVTKSWRDIKHNQKYKKQGPFCSRICAGKGSSTGLYRRVTYGEEDAYGLKVVGEITGEKLITLLDDEQKKRYTEILGGLLEEADKTLLKSVGRKGRTGSSPVSPTLRKKQREKKKTHRFNGPENQCIDCYTWIKKDNTRCRSCHRIHANANKIDWPSLEEVFALVVNTNFSQAAKQLGVSDNAIRKFFNRNGIAT